MSDHPPQFSVKKLWILLLVLTAAEVGYGEIGNRTFYENKLLLWGGLLTFAYFKGYYIFQYFMHMKYEGAIVKGNVWFTVPLVIYLMIMIWPDTAANDKIHYGIARQLDPVAGKIAIDLDQQGNSRNIFNHGYENLQRAMPAAPTEYGYLYSADSEYVAPERGAAAPGHSSGH